MLGKTGLVVSPLISLMEDQVSALNAKGVRACLLGSAQADWRVREDAWTGKYQLVYLTPELATSPGGLERIRALHERHGGVSVLAVDEAHCISEWGRDFRPDFQRLHKVRDEALGPDVPVVAVSNLLFRGGASAGPTPSKSLTKTGASPLDPPGMHGNPPQGCMGIPPRDAWDAWGSPPGMHGDAWGCMGMHGDAWGSLEWGIPRAGSRGGAPVLIKLLRFGRGPDNQAIARSAMACLPRSPPAPQKFR